MSKLTKEQEVQIASRFADGERNKSALGREYGVSARTVGRILARQQGKPKAVEATPTHAFEVGDILTGIEDNPYIITPDQSTVKVVEILPSFCILVEVLSHTHAEQNVGKRFIVHTSQFVKIGSAKEVPQQVVEVQDINVGDKLQVVGVADTNPLNCYSSGFFLDEPQDVKIISIDPDGGDSKDFLRFQVEAEKGGGQWVSFKDFTEESLVELANQNFNEEVEKEVEQDTRHYFKEGERVKLVDILDYLPSGTGNKVGNIGVVHHVEHSQVYKDSWVHVEFENGETNWYSPVCLQLLEDEPEPEQVAHIVTDMAVTLSFEGNMQLIDYTHPSFEKVKQCIVEGRYREASTLMDIKKAIEVFSEGELSVDKGVVSYRGVPVHNALTAKIIQLMGEGDEGFKGFAMFMSKVMQNPSRKTRERLMDFAAAEDIGISLDGDLICFKNVREGFTPSRAGMWKQVDGTWEYDSQAFYDNSVGQSPSMPREEVDDVERNTCSVGLHVCSVRYLKAFWGTSGHTMKVHVDPRDMVAIPPDYHNSKARVCKYTVVENVSGKLDEYLDKIQ